MSIEHIETSFLVPGMSPLDRLTESLTVPLIDDERTIAIDFPRSEFKGRTEAGLVFRDESVVFSLGQAFRCKRKEDVGLYETTLLTDDMLLTSVPHDNGSLGWQVTIRTPATLPSPDELDIDIFTQLALLIENYGIKRNYPRS